MGIQPASAPAATLGRGTPELLDDVSPSVTSAALMQWWRFISSVFILKMSDE